MLGSWMVSSSASVAASSRAAYGLGFGSARGWAWLREADASIRSPAAQVPSRVGNGHAVMPVLLFLAPSPLGLPEIGGRCCGKRATVGSCADSRLFAYRPATGLTLT